MQGVEIWESRELGQKLGFRGRHVGPPMRRGGGPRVTRADGPGKDRHGQHPSSHPLLSVTSCSPDGADGHNGPHTSAKRVRMGVEDQDLGKVHLGEERRQGEAQSHPHCCPELKRCCTRKGSTVSGSSKSPLASDEPREALVTQMVNRKLVPRTKPPPQTLGPSFPGMTDSGRFWQLRPTGSSTVPSVSWGLSQANLPSTLPPTQDPMGGCSEKGGGGQVATS